MSRIKSRATAFCDQHIESRRRPPTLLELIAAVGWVPPQVVRELADGGLLVGLLPRNDRPRFAIFPR